MPNVGNVPNVPYFVANEPEVSTYDVKTEERTNVSKMNVTVDGRAANVHTYKRGIKRLKFFFLFSEWVKYSEFTDH